MMDNTILLKIIIPAQIVAECRVEMVNIPGTEGMFGVLPGHAPLISGIKIGVINVFIGAEEKKYFIFGGVADVKGEEINIVTEFAMDLSEINKSSASKIISEFKAELSELPIDSLEVDIIKAKITKYEALIGYL
jgi:F-type H+-transporting ATPase subunit epsilon